jgi:hypothetical protein
MNKYWKLRFIKAVLDFLFVIFLHAREFGFLVSAYREECDKARE